MTCGLKRLRKNPAAARVLAENIPQRLKPRSLYRACTARLKPCPFTKLGELSFSASCEAVPLHKTNPLRLFQQAVEPCPFTKLGKLSFSASCEAVPLHKTNPLRL